jgi:hypothetical protein
MKDSLLKSLKLLSKERRIITALIVFAIVTLAFIIYVGSNIHPSELKLVTHYSAFGTTNFYRDTWFYLLTFVIFGLTVLIAHTLITLRLLVLKGNELALSFVWVSIIMICIAAAFVNQVLRVAALA